MKLAVIVDGEKKTDMPTSPQGKDGKYYDVQVKCTSSKTTGLWDYNAWRLNLDYIESNSKCNLTFTSSMTKDQYDEYIKSGVALRRNTFRGKDITKYFTGEEEVNGRDLFEQINNGTFDDIYVGDYIVSEQNDNYDKKIVWLIADLDNYYNQGDEGHLLLTHHATIIPSYKLQDSRMNPTDTTEGGYAGSAMYQTTLNEVYDKYIAPDFCQNDSNCHIIEYRNLVSTEVDINRFNQFGLSTGVSSVVRWETRKLDLMSEVNVYGTTIWSSSGNDVGLDNRQYAIFQLRPVLINQGIGGISGVSTGRHWYWLKAVRDSSNFAYVDASGSSNGYGVSIARGVRPRFLID